MAANDYSRTVSITPVGTAYSWDTPPSWITITQVGTTDEWTITVAANTGSARSAVLTVRHDNGTTTDTINVTQAGVTVPPTATPVPPTPTATSVPPTPTPTATTPSSTFSMTSNTTGLDAVEIFGTSSSNPATVSYQILVSGVSPVPPTITTAPSLISPNGWQVNNPTAGLTNIETGVTTWTGTIDVWQMISPTSTLTQEVIVEWAGQTDSFFVVATVSGGGVDPTKGLTGGLVTPTPTSSSGAGPTPTPTTFRLVTPTPSSGGGSGCYQYQILNEGAMAAYGTLTGVTDCSTGNEATIGYLSAGSSTTICTSSSLAAIEVALSNIPNGLTCTVSALGTSC